MRVLFLGVDTEHDWGMAPVGPAFLAAVLRAHGHEASLLRVPHCRPISEVVQETRSRRPDLLGVSLTTRQWLRARDLIRAIRAVVDIPVAVGGAHPSALPQDILAEPCIDHVCVGEGEQTLLDLVEALSRGDSPIRVAGLATRDAPFQARHPVADLDGIPFLARDLLDEHPSIGHMLTQRGCPFPCTFCAASRLMSEARGAPRSSGIPRLRRRSVSNVIAELQGLHRSYVIFLDDTFTVPRSWITEFNARYGDEVGLPFCINTRVEAVNEPLLGDLARTGCRQVNFGVESGSERVRREVLGRQVSDDRILRAFRLAREAGMITTANVMLGVPGERPADVEATLALLEALDPDDFAYFVYYPMPGTALFQTCQERGLLPMDWRERPANHRETILCLPDLTSAEVSAYHARFAALRERMHERRGGTAEILRAFERTG